MTKVTFNGYELTGKFIVSDLQRVFMQRSAHSIEVDGRDGAIYTNTTLDPIEITMTATYAGAHGEISDAFRELAAALNVQEEKPFAISDDGGKYYLAIPSGGSMERWIGAEQAELTFSVFDPRMYGETKTVTVPSGGQLEFQVSGNVYTYPTIEASATRDSSTNQWRLRLDSADYLAIDTGSGAARKIVADCEHRTLTVAGAAALPTLSSDWLVFTPGKHTIINDLGSGAATITYTERWL